MENKDFININTCGWNKLIKDDIQFSNMSLPEYGPFVSNEEKLQLFKEVKDKVVLEVGSGSGKSLEYLSKKGAKEVWGIDISDEQIKRSKKLNIPNSKFILSPMEVEKEIPINYFDYVLSLYSIGYCSDLIKTLELISGYLKPNGKFILCWTHPFFNCLSIEDNKLNVSHSYNDEDIMSMIKGKEKIELVQHNFKISTIINGLISVGMEIDKIIEETPNKGYNNIGQYRSIF